MLFVDHGWLNCSIAKSIVADLFMKGFRGDVMVLGYADSPCPTAGCLEKFFYPDPNSIAAALMKLCGRSSNSPRIEQSTEISEFRGPF
jgi:pyruvate/2-oxoglutarate/acetoin dehydrogenase E1 component